ncbi:hypothetical protein NLI96_g5765 [Meripilus lineatus]|uniref:Uncharacterized protein n=1 Tax=Meripilus lineatus TaxID=2056292 RepID=A0AAD5YEJ5_9APHY|nr:hypothetical protein NLI96_g5765 [Physisporinus lineatus]
MDHQPFSPTLITTSALETLPTLGSGSDSGYSRSVSLGPSVLVLSSGAFFILAVCLLSSGSLATLSTPTLSLSVPDFSLASSSGLRFSPLFYVLGLESCLLVPLWSLVAR